MNKTSNTAEERTMIRPARLRGCVVALLLAALTAACTTIPQREFATYKDTFAKARTAGETVVLDYVRQKQSGLSGTEGNPVRLRLIEKKGVEF